jgi:hypothetical protein
MRKKKWFWGPLIGLKIILVIFLTSLIVMWLWNILVPQVFNGPVITYWQSMGLLVLSKLLFGGIGRGFRGRHHYDHRYRSEEWKEKFRRKMESMTPEEREKFRKKCSSRFYDWDINVDVDKGEENKSGKEIKVEIKNSNS